MLFLRALWRHWRELLSGGSLVVLVLIWQWTGQMVPDSVYPWLLLATFLWACYGAWGDEYRRAEELAGRLRSNLPYVVFEYSLDTGGNEQEPRVRNVSQSNAINIRVAPIPNKAARAVFDVVPVLGSGDVAILNFNVEGVGAVFQHDFDVFLSLYPPKVLRDFLKLRLVVRVEYEDVNGTECQTTSEIEYERVTKSACVVRIS